MKISIFNALYEILLLMPAIAAVITATNRKSSDNTVKKKELATILILLGIFNFPSNIYSKIIIGAFFFTLLTLQNKFNKSLSNSFLFPSSFLFNMTTFSGDTKTESFIMIFYSIIGGSYLIKLYETKKMSSNEEKRYVTISAIVFIICKLCVFFLKVFKQI